MNLPRSFLILSVLLAATLPAAAQTSQYDECADSALCREIETSDDTSYFVTFQSVACTPTASNACRGTETGAILLAVVIEDTNALDGLQTTSRAVENRFIEADTALLA